MIRTCRRYFGIGSVIAVFVSLAANEPTNLTGMLYFFPGIIYLVILSWMPFYLIAILHTHRDRNFFTSKLIEYMNNSNKVRNGEIYFKHTKPQGSSISSSPRIPKNKMDVRRDRTILRILVTLTVVSFLGWLFGDSDVISINIIIAGIIIILAQFFMWYPKRIIK